MKVLVLTRMFPSDWDALSGVFVKERTKALARLCPVEVLAPIPFHKMLRRREAQGTSSEGVDGFRVTHVPYFYPPRILKPLHGFSFLLSVLRAALKIRKRFRFDVIDAHYVYPDAFAAVILGKILRVPVCVTEHGVLRELSRERMRKWLTSYTLRNAARILTVSRSLIPYVVKCAGDPDRIRVIPNGVDITKFHPAPKEEARRALGLPQAARILVSVGRLHPEKGHHLLVECLPAVKRKLPGEAVILAIVGPDDVAGYRDVLKRAAEGAGVADAVRVVGAVPHDRLGSWFSAADVLCLASEDESWPTVIYESFACGTPVVATAVGGIPEIIESEDYGILVQDRSSAELGEAIGQALQKTWDREKLIECARKNTWHGVAVTLVRVLEEIVPQEAI